MPEPVAVVTGVGVVTGVAIGADAFWSARHRAHPPASALALDAAVLRHPPRDGDVVARAALDAAAEAWEQAGLAGGASDPWRVGVVWGVGLAGLRASQRAVSAVAAGRDPAPRDVLGLSPAEPVAALARHLNAAGPCRGVATACASGTDAVADAARLIAAGECDVVVAGAAEAGATPANLAGLRRLGALSPTGVTRPFDSRRDGLVLAEAAAAVVVESPDHARVRGARPLARVLGSASGRDPRAGPVAPGADGAAVSAVLGAALADARVAPDDLRAVLAHATGTAAGDAAEARGLARVLAGGGVPVTAAKGATGHAMAAAGALAAVEAVLALGHRSLPPVVGLTAPCPEAAGLELVHEPREITAGAVACLSVGFGGFTSAVVMGPA